MSRLDAGLKRRLGYALYLIEAFRIWATDPFPFFETSFTNGTGHRRVEDVSQLLAVRVRSFGGVLRNWLPAPRCTTATCICWPSKRAAA